MIFAVAMQQRETVKALDSLYQFPYKVFSTSTGTVISKACHSFHKLVN